MVVDQLPSYCIRQAIVATSATEINKCFIVKFRWCTVRRYLCSVYNGLTVYSSNANIKVSSYCSHEKGKFRLNNSNGTVFAFTLRHGIENKLTTRNHKSDLIQKLLLEESLISSRRPVQIDCIQTWFSSFQFAYLHRDLLHIGQTK